MTSKPDVPGFIIADRLGSGSYAIVYKAFSKAAKRDVVAIKCIQKSSLNKAATENLMTEISILKKLKHRHIVQMKDFLWDEKHIYLIMEYCSGGDLSTFIRTRRTLSERVVKCFLQQLAIALQFLRAENVAHMDLKPQNILLTSRSKPILKLADFGFAQYLQSDDDAATSMRGSPLYMAPEILLKHKYDARVDLWSVGVILYECLFGRAPYSSHSFAELAKRIMNPKPIEIPYGVDVSQECRDLMKRLLQRDPKQRISFEEFFSHPFVDLNHMPSEESYAKAVEFIAEAVEMDSKKQYSEAVKLYCQALQHFVPAIHYEEDLERKAAMRDRVKQYLNRAEELKAIMKPNQSENHLLNSISPRDELGMTYIANHSGTSTDMTHLASVSALLAVGEPHLQAALKIAEVAEELENVEKYEEAIEKYQLALGTLIPFLSGETKGKRKEILHSQVQRWLSNAEHIKSYLSIGAHLPVEETILDDPKEIGESLRQQCCVQ